MWDMKEQLKEGKKYLAKKTNKEWYYEYLFFNNSLHSHYPKKLTNKKIEKKVEYIFKHNNGKIKIEGKTSEKLYDECCDFLDKIAKPISQT